MGKSENIPCKRLLKEESLESNQKKRISLSLRKTRQKKEVSNSSQQRDLNQNSETMDMKIPAAFDSTDSLKREEKERNDSLNCIKLPFIPNLTLLCSLKCEDRCKDNAAECIKFEDLNNVKATAHYSLQKHEYSENKPSGYIQSSLIQGYQEQNNFNQTYTSTIAVEYEYQNYQTKEECNSPITNTVKYEYQEDQDIQIKEEYDCPVCGISLTYITSTEFRQKHVEDCISSAQYVEQVFDGCIVCGKELSNIGLHQRQIHINHCLDGPTATTYNDVGDDFATQNIICRNKQRLPKPTREEDKKDEMYQTTLAMSKSLLKADKKIKIEMNEANIWSNHESRRKASHKLYQLLDAKNELDMTRQTEREVSVGYLNPSSVCTLPTSLSSCTSLSINCWELAGLLDSNPLFFTSSFLRQFKE